MLIQLIRRGRHQTRIHLVPHPLFIRVEAALFFGIFFKNAVKVAIIYRKIKENPYSKSEIRVSIARNEGKRD
jgi:hypothetical protein